MRNARLIFVSCSLVALVACGDDDGTTDPDSGPEDSGVDSSDATADPCGNGTVDDGEQCDDMNDVNGDGCDVDCTYSCEEAADCDDGAWCTGEESCDTDTHTCVAGTPVDCSDADDCTEDVCNEDTMTCTNPLIDEDGDGHAPDTIGACGDDCDDTRADVYTGAEELCDGVDNNCNTDIDEVAPTWYIDCDDDGFAADTGGSRTGCDEPPGTATGCGGGWVTRRPVDGDSTDCDDSNADMFPGQTSFFTAPHDPRASGDDARFGNYNCNGTAERDRTTNAGVATDATCDVRYFSLRDTAICQGSSGWVESTAPSCGSSGNFSDCPSTPVECIPSPRETCAGYTLLCVGPSRLITDPCFCRRPPCTPTCDPGTRGCEWHYYRCTRDNLGRTFMGCR